jgi:hypothetical protein
MLITSCPTRPVEGIITTSHDNGVGLERVLRHPRDQEQGLVAVLELVPVLEGINNNPKRLLAGSPISTLQSS